MFTAFAAALAAALAFGIASLLQEAGAHRAPAHGAVGLRLLGRFVRQPAFLVGTALDAAGFVLTFLALRRLPLFAVEAAVSSALAVTAVGSVVRGGRLSRGQRWAVAAVVVGLGLVGATARPEPPPALSGTARLALLAGIPALAVAGAAAGRRRRTGRGPAAAPLLGGLAGLAFALFGVAGRVLPDAGLGLGLARQPLAWAAVAYVALGLLLYGAALQRGAVTAVAASTAAVETIVPAAVGLFLGGGARPGLVPVAVVGFVVTTAATLLLVRPGPEEHGEAAGPVPECPDLAPEPVMSDISPSSRRRRAPLTAV